MHLADSLAFLSNLSHLLTQDELKHVLHSVAADSSLSMPNVPSHKEIPYSRELLLKTDHLEVLMLCWAPGMTCAPHDHGQSYGAVKVLKGCLTNTFFQFKNNSFFRVQTSTLYADQVCSVNEGKIHAMANPLDVPSFSLHIYVKPIIAMTVYNLDQCCYCTVPDDHGVRWPHDKLSIIDDRFSLT